MESRILEARVRTTRNCVTQRQDVTNDSSSEGEQENRQAQENLRFRNENNYAEPNVRFPVPSTSHIDQEVRIRAETAIETKIKIRKLQTRSNCVCSKFYC